MDLRAGLDEQKILWSLPGNEPQFLGRPDRSLVNTPTMLFRLMNVSQNRVGVTTLRTEFQIKT